MAYSLPYRTDKFARHVGLAVKISLEKWESENEDNSRPVDVLALE